MVELLSGAELIARLTATTAAHDVEASSDSRTIRGAHEAIKSKWFLGGRKVTYKMSCEIDEPSRSVRFRESSVESSWGVPPPALTVEKTTERGARVTESRTERAVGGGGRLDYGSLRADVEDAVRSAGWKFVFESGRPS